MQDKDWECQVMIYSPSRDMRSDMLHVFMYATVSVHEGLRCPTTSGVMAAKITSAWVSLSHSLLFCLKHSVSCFITLTFCLCRGPLQCREEESGELLHHANLQVNMGELVCLQDGGCYRITLI